MIGVFAIVCCRSSRKIWCALSFDVLTLFGLLAVSAMLLFYALEDRSPWFIFAFAIACASASIYGFLQGRLALRRH